MNLRSTNHCSTLSWLLVCNNDSNSSPSTFPFDFCSSTAGFIARGELKGKSGSSDSGISFKRESNDSSVASGSEDLKWYNINYTNHKNNKKQHIQRINESGHNPRFYQEI